MFMAMIVELNARSPPARHTIAPKSIVICV